MGRARTTIAPRSLGRRARMRRASGIFSSRRLSRHLLSRCVPWHRPNIGAAPFPGYVMLARTSRSLKADTRGVVDVTGSVQTAVDGFVEQKGVGYSRMCKGGRMCAKYIHVRRSCTPDELSGVLRHSKLQYMCAVVGRFLTVSS